MTGQRANLFGDRWHPLRDANGPCSEKSLGKMGFLVAADEADHRDACSPRGRDAGDAVFDCHAKTGRHVHPVNGVLVHIGKRLGSSNLGRAEEVRAEQAGAHSPRYLDDPVEGSIRHDGLHRGEAGDDVASATHDASLTPDHLIHMTIKLVQLTRPHPSVLDFSYRQQRACRLSSDSIDKSPHLRWRKTKSLSSPCRENTSRNAFAVHQHAIAVEEDDLGPNGWWEGHGDRRPLRAAAWQCCISASMGRVPPRDFNPTGRALRLCQTGTAKLQSWRAFTDCRETTS